MVFTIVRFVTMAMFVFVVMLVVVVVMMMMMVVMVMPVLVLLVGSDILLGKLLFSFDCDRDFASGVVRPEDGSPAVLRSHRLGTSLVAISSQV